MPLSNKSGVIFFILLSAMALNALTPADIRQQAFDKGLKAIPKDFATLKEVVDDAKNPITPAKIELGKKLFFDKNLSQSREIACVTCHDLAQGGEDSLATAIGHNNLANPKHLNTPTVFNTAFSKHFFWDGRSPSLRDQAKGPLQMPFEMASTPELIVQRVEQNPEYKALFAAAFGDKEAISLDTITKAIEVYEKTLVTRASFDDFLDGDDGAISAKAQKGLELFIDLGCKGCHFGYSIGGQEIQQFPLREYNTIINLSSGYNDVSKKRYFKNISLNFEKYHPFPFTNIGGFMGKDEAKKFRVPTLRNITLTAPYFHNGVIKDLREAIFIMGRYQLGVDLSKQQIDEIEAFLQALEAKK